MDGGGCGSGAEDGETIVIWELSGALHPLGLVQGLLSEVLGSGLGSRMSMDTGSRLCAPGGSFILLSLCPSKFRSTTLSVSEST